MYERNAIVLERYFYNLFKYNENSNLKENFNNYCNLVDCFEKFKNTTEEETNATNEFEKAISDIKKLQKTRRKIIQQKCKT